jgi:hypothetical protein
MSRSDQQTAAEFAPPHRASRTGFVGPRESDLP